MKQKYLYLYNNLINYTRNKDLYKNLNREDNFSDRLTLFLLHFSFFLKNYKNDDNKRVLQEIYDFNFRQLELSIREIGYGDQSINKKMKDYINLFHSMVSEIHFWEDLSKNEKLKKISIFLSDFENIEFFTFEITKKEIASLFDVQYQTTLLIFKNNKEVYRSIGETSRAAIYKAIKSSI